MDELLKPKRRIIRTAREAVRRAYEVQYIPESERMPSPLDLLIQRVLAERGKVFVLMEKTARKKFSAQGLVRRLRRRAEEGGVDHITRFVSRSSWSDGLVRVYGQALTQEQYAALNSSTNKEKHDERDRDEDRGADRGEAEGGEEDRAREEDREEGPRQEDEGEA